jgi:hypothetical protein
MSRCLLLPSSSVPFIFFSRLCIKGGRKVQFALRYTWVFFAFTIFIAYYRLAQRANGHNRLLTAIGLATDRSIPPTRPVSTYVLTSYVFMGTMYLPYSQGVGGCPITMYLPYSQEVVGCLFLPYSQGVGGCPITMYLPYSQEVVGC